MPKISALPELTHVQGNDVLAGVDTSEGDTVKIPVNNIMPTGTILDFAGDTAPDGFLLCYGQTLDGVANPEYAALYAVIGITYGGSGISSFNVPDLRGRVAAGQDDMGGVSANRLTGVTGSVDGDGLGNAGGEEAHALTIAELAAHTHSVDNTMSFTTSGPAASNLSPAAILTGNNSGRYNSSPQNMGDTSGSTGSGTAHNTVQPTIILNKIIKL